MRRNQMTQISHLLRRSFSCSSSQSSVSRVINKEPDLKRVVEAFKEYSKNKQFRKTPILYEQTVKRLANAKHYDLIQQIFDEQKLYPEIKDEGFVVRLISLYGKCGMFDHARKLFDEMPELNCSRTVKSFNALLGACVNSKKFDMVDGFFVDLPGKLCIKPNNVSYNTRIRAFCEMGTLDSAVLKFDEMVKEGVKPDLFTFNILLDGFYKKDRFLDGENIWGLMEKCDVVPDIISYNIRLHRLVLNKNEQEAVKLVGEMKFKGVKPNVLTFNTLFKGLCNIEENLEEAKTWFGEMMKAKCAPNRAIFSTLLRLACKKGDFVFASRVCKSVIYYKCELNDGSLLEKVLDGLKQSSVEEAEILLQLFERSKLKMHKKTGK